MSADVRCWHASRWEGEAQIVLPPSAIFSAGVEVSARGPMRTLIGKLVVGHTR